jgi:formiminotetrahydrofolate cyclodeaminase
MRVAEQSIGTFLDAVASNRVTPSGGAVAAVGGAAGAALCEMVCVHTIGTAEDGDVEAELADAAEHLAASRTRLLELADEDERAVEWMQSAFAAHGGHASETQRALEGAIEVPLETAEVCLDVLACARDTVADGTDRATADAATGAFLAHAALESSVGTVRANLELVEDETFVAETGARADKLDTAGDRALDTALLAGPAWCR